MPNSVNGIGDCQILLAWPCRRVVGRARAVVGAAWADSKDVQVGRLAATTGPKSHDTGPELLLIELLGGVPVCAETEGMPRSNSTRVAAESMLTRVINPMDRSIRINSPLQWPSSKKSPFVVPLRLLFGRIGATLPRSFLLPTCGHS